MVAGLWALAGLFALVAAQRISELRLAKRNEARALERGARVIAEPWYWMFFVLHTGWLLGWVAEGWLRGAELDGLWPLWLAGFALASALRYWAIASLGERWNTRIVVFAGEPLVRAGPYRFIAHPNYLAVALELACVPMIFGAWWTAGICSLLNAFVLLGLRIPAEVRAIREASGEAGEAKKHE